MIWRFLGRRGLRRAALTECSLQGCQGGSDAAKSPVVAVVTVITVHLCFLDLWPFSAGKNKTPGRVADRGFVKTSLVATLLARAPVGYQARLWLNQYPK